MTLNIDYMWDKEKVTIPDDGALVVIAEQKSYDVVVDDQIHSIFIKCETCHEKIYKDYPFGEELRVKHIRKLIKRFENHNCIGGDIHVIRERLLKALANIDTEEEYAIGLAIYYLAETIRKK